MALKETRTAPYAQLYDRSQGLTLTVYQFEEGRAAFFHNCGRREMSSFDIIANFPVFCFPRRGQSRRLEVGEVESLGWSRDPRTEVRERLTVLTTAF